jgi:hypothetical protein
MPKPKGLSADPAILVGLPPPIRDALAHITDQGANLLKLTVALFKSEQVRFSLAENAALEIGAFQHLPNSPV